MNEKDIKVVNTDNSEANRCPSCGGSDVVYDISKKKLVCNYCHAEFESDIQGIEKEAKNLKEEVRGSGTTDVNKNLSDIVTLKCVNCGAEVTINTKEDNNFRCHWCRSVLSLDSQVANGMVPDVILPFSLSKEEAQKKINAFVSKRKFFAKQRFKKEFTSDNIMGVYFPYMLIDANYHGIFKGQGGRIIRTYKPGENSYSNSYNLSGNSSFVYDIDIYNVEREFDIVIDDLTIESSLDKLDKGNKDKTTNIINSIMPFDTENCVKFESNYLAGYTSEKRDINIENIDEKVKQEMLDITRHALADDMTSYNAGVKWMEEQLNINGKQWVSAYLPVWLYSYQDNKKVLHYVAVNARTGETMGSVPLDKMKLRVLSLLALVLFIVIPLITKAGVGMMITSIIAGIVFSIFLYSIIDNSYRNKSARHKYEVETKRNLSNISRRDHKVRTKIGSTSNHIAGINTKNIKGENTEVEI